MGGKNKGFLEAGKAEELAGLVEYQDGGVVSRTIYRGPHGTLTVFAFDKGQDLSEHTAPFDAFILVLDGVGQITVGGAESRVEAGQMIFMPGGIPHAVSAPERFKMLLCMFRANK